MENVKLGEVLNDTFPVTTKRGAPVTGLVDKDFQKVLYGPDGAEITKQTPVTVSELGNGMYRLNFRPDKTGQWSAMVSHALHCPWGISGTYQVEEAEAAVEETEEGNLTPYVILRHWPDEPGPDLMEHWDIKLKSPQGTMYEWSSMDDPFETADGILGEVTGCCGGEKALELEGEIELAPGSPWNQTKVPAHLGLVQSGQVHFVTEEPGFVVAYLDQLPFRAVQEGNTDEWDITLGVWASMSKARYTELMALPVDEYDPKELTDAVLNDDFRIATSWYATLKEGKEIDKTENEIRDYAKKIAQEIVARDRVVFNLAQMKDTSRELLVDIIKNDIEPYAELRTLVEHTKDELERAGLFDADSDYGGMMAKSVLAIMKLFAKQGHSGFSAAMCKDLFQRLSSFETLTPITSDPKEWNDVSEMCGGTPMWQNNRNPAMFSEDGGKTWYDVNEKDRDAA